MRLNEPEGGRAAMEEKNEHTEITSSLPGEGPVDGDPILIGGGRVDAVLARISRKMEDYQDYAFTSRQSVALNVFFDLAQEFPDIEDLYAIFLLIPRQFFDLESELHVLGRRSGELRRCACRCIPGKRSPLFPKTPTVSDNRFSIPIRGNHELISQLPFAPKDDIIGVLDIFPADRLTDHDKLFFERYANRFGYQLHNRILTEKNKEHVAFIKSLVKDIGHNVIVPNIYFKLYYNQLHSKIGLLDIYKKKLAAVLGECASGDEDVVNDLDYIRQTLTSQYNQIHAHYLQTSLFLETLLRRSHFEQGRYVLEKRRCNFKKQVIDPQVERYRNRLEERQVEIDTSLGGVPDKEIEVVVDVGLISQVYANLFSNAVKYTREIVDDKGRKRKFLSYGRQVKPDYFGPGRDGVKFNVFSSGPPISPEEGFRLFDEGYRRQNDDGEYGVGHGLYFVREVVRLHGGLVGFENTPLGNNFFFVLPNEPDPAGLAGRVAAS